MNATDFPLRQLGLFGDEWLVDRNGASAFFPRDGVSIQRPSNSQVETYEAVINRYVTPTATQGTRAVEFELVNRGPFLMGGPLSLSFKVGESTSGTAFTSGRMPVDNFGAACIDKIEFVHDQRVKHTIEGTDILDWKDKLPPLEKENWNRLAWGGFGNDGHGRFRRSLLGAIGNKYCRVIIPTPFMSRDRLFPLGQFTQAPRVRVYFHAANRCIDNPKGNGDVAAAATSLNSLYYDDFTLDTYQIYQPKEDVELLKSRLNSVRGLKYKTTFFQRQEFTTLGTETLGSGAANQLSLKLENFNVPAYLFQVLVQYQQFRAGDSDGQDHDLEEYIPIDEMAVQSAGRDISPRIYPRPICSDSPVALTNDVPDAHINAMLAFPHEDHRKKKAYWFVAHPSDIVDSERNSHGHIVLSGYNNPTLVLNLPSGCSTTGTTDRNLYRQPDDFSNEPLYINVKAWCHQLFYFHHGEWEVEYTA